MIYNAPESPHLLFAIDVIQSLETKAPQGPHENPIYHEIVSAYEDWEN
jgi:hypothetical protein